MLTKIQVSCLPIALFNKVATTDESTPPDNAKITFSFLTLFCISLIKFLIMFVVVQDFLHLQILITKLFMIIFPLLV